MVPGTDDPRWTRILQSRSDVSSATLATKFMVTRLRREVTMAPSCLPDKIAELRAFFEKNSFVRKDIPLL